MVGAGPAGASAAYAAAVAGRRVLLLEKAELPRYKTCGGGIIGPSRDSLPPGFELPFRDRVHAVTFSLNGRFARTRRSRQMLFGLINRPEFDQQLVEHAQKAGAELRTGVTVQRVEQHGSAVPDRRTVAVVLQGGETVLARAVVGADGSASRIGAHVGVKLDQVDLGLEAEIPVPETVAEDWKGRVLIDWGPMPGSYGWVFPKGDTLTVGVISARGEGAATKRYLEDLVRKLASILAEAQRLGFAEADPSFDIDGVDAAHKLSILASVAFGTQPAFGDVAINGIRHVLAADIAEAAALGYRVRLLGIADSGPAGLFQRVHPHLVPLSHPLAHVAGSTQRRGGRGQFRRAAVLRRRRRGRWADRLRSGCRPDRHRPRRIRPALCDASRIAGGAGPGRQRRAARARLCPLHRGRPGWRARRDRRGDARRRVSIESLMQRGANPDGNVLVAIVTHEGPERCVAQALERLRGSASLVGEPMWMHILGELGRLSRRYIADAVGVDGDRQTPTDPQRTRNAPSPHGGRCSSSSAAVRIGTEFFALADSTSGTRH